MKKETRERIEALERRVAELERRQGPIWVVSPGRYTPSPTYIQPPSFTPYPGTPVNPWTTDRIIVTCGTGLSTIACGSAVAVNGLAN